jgi:hypothetical protein
MFLLKRVFLVAVILLPALAFLPTPATGQVNWVQILSPSGSPSSRCCVGMVFDVVHRSHVLFGGADGSGNPLGDTWQLRDGQWSQLFPAVSPPARQGPGMVYDGATNTVVLFGGTSGTTSYNDTWIWDGTTATWTEVFPPNSPPGRRFDTQGMAFDLERGEVVLFGGYAAGTVLNDANPRSPGATVGARLRQLVPFQVHVSLY